MAKTKKGSETITRKATKKIKRKGRHSKKKTSILKTSKNYKKLYNSQGK